jgi:hypothetical protein
MGIHRGREGNEGGDDARQLMALATTYAEARLAVLAMAAVRTILPPSGSPQGGSAIRHERSSRVAWVLERTTKIKAGTAKRHTGHDRIALGAHQHGQNIRGDKLEGRYRDPGTG